MDVQRSSYPCPKLVKYHTIIDLLYLCLFSASLRSCACGVVLPRLAEVLSGRGRETHAMFFFIFFLVRMHTWRCPFAP